MGFNCQELDMIMGWILAKTFQKNIGVSFIIENILENFELFGGLVWDNKIEIFNLFILSRKLL